MPRSERDIAAHSAVFSFTQMKHLDFVTECFEENTISDKQSKTVTC